MIRKKLAYSDLKNEIEKQIHKYMPRFVLIEDKAKWATTHSRFETFWISEYKSH